MNAIYKGSRHYNLKSNIDSHCLINWLNGNNAKRFYIRLVHTLKIGINPINRENNNGKHRRILWKWFRFDKKVAALIAQQFDIDSNDIADVELEDLEQYDLIILGTPTVNNGEIQSDWDYVLDDIEDLNLTDTKVAVFGLGDQIDYADTFVDAMADLAQTCEEAGATLIGSWPSKGYTHSESRAEKNGFFVGLAIDMERQAEQTHKRVENWVSQLKSFMNE